MNQPLHVRHNRRKHAYRAKSIEIRQLEKNAPQQRLDLAPPPELPENRGACQGGHRPCPLVSCRYHLAVDVTEAGSLKVNHPGLEIEEHPETCALDVADKGGATLEEIGELLNVTREAVRLIEQKALRRLRQRAPHLRELFGALEETSNWDEMGDEE